MIPSAAKSTSSETPATGIVCPRCGCRHFEVLETRRTVGGVLRRRRCRHCGRRVTTRERIFSR